MNDKKYTIEWNEKTNHWRGVMGGEGSHFITMSKSGYQESINIFMTIYHTAKKDGYLDINHPVQVDHENIIYTVTQRFNWSGNVITIFSWVELKNA